MWNRPHGSARAYGLVRLTDLLNCSLIGLAGLVSELTLQDIVGSQIERGLVRLVDDSDDVIAEETRSRLKGWIEKIGYAVAQEYEMSAARDRIERFSQLIAKPDATNREVHYQIKALREAVDDGLRGQFLYRYPKDKAEVLASWKRDWKTVLESFSDTEADIKAGVDIWALGHHTASVFHMMRVLEYGLGALARNVGRVFDIQNWYNIINEIEAAIKQEDKTLARGPEKNERLRFLSEAAKEFSYFKDGWRNYVSHNKCTYDEHQARSVMEHTRHFMTILASNLSAEVLAKSDQEPDQNPESPHQSEAPERLQ
ncbi:hypothetical protein [Mesorhizobium sp. WSM3868]|uniref:hypothetical protein n=1 Tax=Mesorhizobium sp. WSM3868 TaxID=2029405 RepID=UPI0015CAE7DE|nr:hypothetical protein [Mesorhizobium sp. WSM3868]